MKVLKDVKIDFRLSQQEKEKIKERAAAMGISVGEFVRWACAKVFESNSN